MVSAFYVGKGDLLKKFKQMSQGRPTATLI